MILETNNSRLSKLVGFMIMFLMIILLKKWSGLLNLCYFFLNLIFKTLALC